MNEETNTPEPLSAILAEMRDGIHTGRADIIDCVNDRLRSYADRIEAAAEREYEEAKNYFAKLHDGPSMICTAKNCAVRNVGLSLAAPGNAAAMRSALEWAAQFVELGVDDDLGADGQNLATASEMARAALAAPARNCDRPECATAEGAIAALRANPCANHDFCKEQLDCAECAARWLVAPAEGGAE